MADTAEGYSLFITGHSALQCAQKMLSKHRVSGEKKPKQTPQLTTIFTVTELSSQPWDRNKRNG